MGDGFVSSHRWQPDRKLSIREKAIYCAQHHGQLQARNRWLEKENEKLALQVVALNKELVKHQTLVQFTSGDKVGNGNTRE